MRPNRTRATVRTLARPTGRPARVLGSLCLFTMSKIRIRHLPATTPRRKPPCRQEGLGSWQGNGRPHPAVGTKGQGTQAKADKPIKARQHRRSTPDGQNQMARTRWWRRTGSNRRPHACKARALPTELRPRRPAPPGFGGVTLRYRASRCLSAKYGANHDPKPLELLRRRPEPAIRPIGRAQAAQRAIALTIRAPEARPHAGGPGRT
jgi:hypothetical protein